MTYRLSLRAIAELYRHHSVEQLTHERRGAAIAERATRMEYCVYISNSALSVLYTGVTRDLP